MVETILQLIREKYPLTEHHGGEYESVSVGPMSFTITAYEAEGLGNVSLMQGTTPHGEMKMDTVIVNPFARDMALFSYDRIYAMGTDTLFLELYDTRIARKPIDQTLSEIVSRYVDIPEEPVKPNWYDDIRFKESIEKKGDITMTPRFDEFAEAYIREYLRLCEGAETCDCKEKKQAAAAYTEGLLSAGGPSTDNFVKIKGREFTEKLFRDVLFATGERKNEQ